jgi:hypothetical protein
MRKRLTWAIGALTALTCVFLLVYWIAHDRITIDNFNLIKMQASRNDIRWVLGGPVSGPDQTERLANGRVRETWIGRDGAILLHFDNDDKLFWMEWDENQWRRTWLTNLGFGRQNIRE